MPNMTRDRVVHPLLLSLRNCLASQLAHIERPVCFLPVMFGANQPPADSCTCECADNGQGQGWVRHVQTTPTQFGATRNASRSRQLSRTGCMGGLGLMDATVELGVYRCHPMLDDDGNPPDDDTYTAHARGMHADMMALRRVLGCCPALEELSPTLDSLAPTGPAGGCSGAVLTFKVRIEECGCPE